jgi:hypothetical protein
LEGLLYRQNVGLSDLFLVEYMLKQGVTDVDRIFAFVSALRTGEAATVERRRSTTEPLVAVRESAYTRPTDGAAAGGRDN